MKHLPIAFILSTAALSLPAAAYNFISVPGVPEMFGANWDTSANLLSTHSGSDWSGSITPRASSGKFKFAANKSWDVNWGGDFSVLRVPAYGVGPLVRGGNDLSWENAAIGTAHTFVFHETSTNFDIVPTSAAARDFSSLQLVGDFNHRGADPAGALTKNGNLWKGEIEVPGGSDSFLLRVDNQELWGLAASRSATLPVSNVSFCGSASLNVSGIKSGTLAVTFDPAKLLLSVSQKTTNAFVSKYIAADVSFAAGSPCDVNLEETDDGHWTADFVVTNGASVPFTLTLSQRDAKGNQGGYFWGATNASAGTRTYPVSELLSRTDDPAAAAPVKCPGGIGRYRVSFAPATQELSVRRLYYQSGRVNLLPDPSLESRNADGIPTGGGVSAWNARIVDAVLDNGVRYGAHSGARAAFFPPAGGGQDDSSAAYGSLSFDLPVTNGIGASLLVSAYLRALGSWDGTTQIQLTWIGADGAAVGEHRFDLLSPDPVAWKYYSTETVVPDNARSAHVVWLYSSAPASGGLLLDDLEIRLASSRSQNFDAWTSILDKWSATPPDPDWTISPYGKTVDNSKDLALPPGGLLISKYIEGTGNNKAIEIFNGTDDAVDLSQYNLAQYDNGTNAPSAVIDLSGTLAPGACFVVTRPVHNPAYPPDSALLAAAAASGMTSKLLTFNGDDVIVLRKGTTVLDRVGQVSSAASSAFWAFVCKNRTLVRHSTVHTGTVSAVTAAFDLSQWDLLPCDDFTDLGSHSRSLGDDVFVPSGLSYVFNDNKTGTASLGSPHLDGGIGDLSFWYRAATATNTASATLRVEGSADGTTFETLATLAVPPTLVSFTNFSLFVNRADLSYLRFTEVTGDGASHVRIDDVSTTASVPASRYQDFNAWTNSSWSAYDGTYSLASWTIADGRIAPAAGSSGTPAALLKPDASLTSPVFASGIGTVVFLAARDASSGSSDPAKITFQITSDGGATWTDAASISVTNTAWASLTVPADIPSSASVRFLSSGDSPLLLDNIELRVYEGTARSQNFNTWPNSNSYGALSGQGWTVDEGYVENGPDGKMLRMKTKNKSLTSPVFSGGLGTLSLDAKSYNASKASAFSVDISTNGGTSWTFNVFSNATTGDFKTYSYPVRNDAVNRVRVSQANGNSINLDNVVCGVKMPDPSVTITATVSPDPLDLETPFSFSASVQPVGDAAVSAVSVRWQTVVGKTTNAWTTNALSYAAASDSWTSPAFSPLSEGTRVQYQAFAVWSSLELSGIQTTYSDIYTNLASAVAGGGVWINEIFYKIHELDGGCPEEDPFCDAGSEGGVAGQQNHEYIEICGPTNQSIAGWSLRIEFARAQEIGANSNIARYATITLPPNASLNNNAKDGYGFYLVGDVNPDWTVNCSLKSAYVPATVDPYAADVLNNIHDSEGVIRLCNNNGSQIDAISYGRNYGALTNAGTQPDGGSYALAITGHDGYHASSPNFSWIATNATPGTVNPDQTFTNRPVSVRTLPTGIRHVPGEKVTPASSSSSVAPFYMLDPQPARVADLLDFAIAFPSAYDDKSSGALFLRREFSATWTSNRLAFYDGARNKSGEDFLHLPSLLPAYTFSRLETVSYYFSFTPSDTSAYLTGYLASDDEGGCLVYSNQVDAIDHPFTVTFPFHDEFSFTAFAPASAGNRWTATLVDEGEFDTPPAWSELRLEVNTNGLVFSNAWDSWAFDPDGDPAKNVDEKITTYRLFLDLPPSPAFFRIAPARQPLPQP